MAVRARFLHVPLLLLCLVVGLGGSEEDESSDDEGSRTTSYLFRLLFTLGPLAGE